MNYLCKICNKDVKLLKNHLRITHQITFDDYFLKYPNDKENYDLFNKSLKIIRQKNSPNCIDFYINKGFNIEESQILLEKHRSKQPFRNRKDFRPNQIDYWKLKGYNEEESLFKMKEFQSNDLNILINKYGYDDGKKRYENFIYSLENRKETEINNYINSGFSVEESNNLYNKIRIENSPRRIEYWINKGFDEKESLLKVSEWQIISSPRRIEHWINKGYNEEESLLKVSEWQDFTSLTYLITNKGMSFEDAINKQDIIIQKMLETKIQKGKIISFDERNDFSKFLLLVWRETNKNYRIYKNIINPLNIQRNINNHLDHRYSIFEGFRNNIDYKIIGSIFNLEIIDSKLNLMKNIKCSITIEELIEKYNDNNKTK